jgi:LuxR family transcriptional regulator, maltose regulon positive regulatory protein
VPESKLKPPVVRAGIVARTALVQRLAAAHAVPIISIVAPAGYGKTTLLAQWAERRGPPVAWISCDDGDNDRAVLLTSLAAAVARVAPIDASVFRMLASGGPLTVVPRFMAAISATESPVALALDHAEAITEPDCLDTLAEFALRLPPGWQLAVASRHALPLPVARLRAHGRLLEVGANDLAMSSAEAGSLLEGAGLQLSEAGVAELVERTEGWPTGLYLAARAIRAGTPQRETGFACTGDDRYLRGYLRSELLDRASPAELSFLIRTSVLDRMCGPLCDAVLGRSGSGRVLERLERQNLLVVPLDRRREWYRYHQLFQQLLRSELGRREPELVRGLHSRAAVWFEASGMPEAAVGHAQASGDADQVARLVLDLAQPVWASGRVDTVQHWMAWFERERALERYPAIAVHGALIFALLGQPEDTERWAAVARRGSPAGTLPDGSTMRSLLAYLRAILAGDGVEAMRRDARASLEGLSATSPYRATMRHTEGIAYLLVGRPERADPILAEAFEDAVGTPALPLAALVLAERSIAAIDQHDWSRAGERTDRALDLVRDGQFEHYWTSALVFATAARTALHRGEPRQARQLVAEAARLRPLLNYALPVVSVQALLELATAFAGLGDAGGADAVLLQVHDILRKRPRLGVLPERVEQLQSTLDILARETTGASSLTTAELRLLPLLPTHLSLTEIGGRLQVSRHTVKTQAGSVYRKLGVSSRGEAVTRARDLGLQL